MNLKICHRKIDVSREASVNCQNISQNTRPATEFARCHHELDAALTMRFAKNTQHDTSKILHLPLEMTMELSKVLRLLRKLQLIF